MSLADRLKELVARTRGSSAGPSFGELQYAARRNASPRGRRSAGAEDEEDIEPTEEFKLVLELARQGPPFILVTGQAGTGKTTLIRWLRRKLRGNVVVVAPTGLAALTARGQTIHSFFGFPPRPIEDHDIKRRRDPAIFEKMEFLIIDEISMVSCEIIDAIDRFLRLNRRRSRDPFGGVKIIALGDLFQLPPVITSENRARLSQRYETFHFFGAHCLRETVPIAVDLTRPFRQDDEHFLSLLRSIREGRDLEEALAQLNEGCFDSDFDDENWLVAVPRRARAEAINRHRLSALAGYSKEYVGVLSGEFLRRNSGTDEPSASDQERALPAPYRLELKAGARVIFTQNDRRKRWVNGTTGTVHSVEDSSVEVELDETDGHIVEVGPSRWTKEKYVLDRASDEIRLKEIGAYEQLPLAPAWAITIHKVQGQTLSRLFVDLEQGAFAAGQTYVAVSRCRSMDGLRLKRPIFAADVQVDPEIRAFRQAIEESLANRVLSE